MRWYKRDPDAALNGMAALTLEEVGAYNIILDLLYSRDGDVPNDERWMARACRCDPRVWRRVRDSLIAHGKIWITEEGRLCAKRVEQELNSAHRFIEHMRKIGRSSAQKRKGNNTGRSTGPLVTSRYINTDSESVVAGGFVDNASALPTNATGEQQQQTAIETKFGDELEPLPLTDAERAALIASLERLRLARVAKQEAEKRQRRERELKANARHRRELRKQRMSK